MKAVFKPERSSKANAVSDAERTILEFLREKAPLTGRRIYDEIHQSKSSACTTVLALLGRMVKKGVVRRRQADGLLVFKAAMKKSEFEDKMAAAAMKGILEISPSAAISNFVDAISEWDRSKVDEVVKIVEQRRKSGGK